MSLDVCQGQMEAILRVHLRSRGLRHNWHGARFPAVDMGAIIHEHGVWRLGQMRSETKLVTHGAREGPQGSLLSSQFFQPILQFVNRLITGLIIEIILERSVENCLDIDLKLRSHVLIRTKHDKDKSNHTFIILSTGTVTTSERKSCSTRR